MKKVFLALLILISTVSAAAQSTTVSSTGMVDSDSFTWANAKIIINFVAAPNVPNFSSYTWSGGTLAPQYSTTANGSGAFSISLPSNTAVTPFGSKWQLYICPNATAGCFSYVLNVTGGTQDITTALNAVLPGPRFPASSNNFGYGPAEISSLIPTSTVFFNTTTTQCQQYSGSAWQNCGTGGSPSGAAGGDLNGTYPNPTVSGAHITSGTINGAVIGGTNPVAGTFTTVSAGTAVTAPLLDGLTDLNLQTGATPQAQFTGLVNSVVAQQFVFVPPQTTGGDSTSYPSASSPLNSYLRTLDLRGTNCMDQFGTFTGNSNNYGGPCIYSVETRQDVTNSYSADLALGYNSVAGGVYNYNGSTGTKSNRWSLLVNGTHSTAAQKWGIGVNLTSYVGGESIPVGIQNTEYGGFVSTGQEPSEGIRIEQDQGTLSDGAGGVWAATVSSISGSTVTFSAPSNGTTLGETRFIRDLNHKYTGSYTNVVCSGTGPTTCTVTGTGFSSLPGYASNPHTTWNTLSTGGNILSNNATFCLPLNQTGVFDSCVPINNVTNDTTLTVNLFNTGTNMNTAWPWAVSGSYAIYRSAYPTAVNVALNTFTASDVTGIGNGDSVDQVEAYNTTFSGIKIIQGMQQGVIGPIGLYILGNYNSASAPGGGSGVAVGGNYQCAFCVDGDSISGNPQNALYIKTGGVPTTGLINWSGSPFGNSSTIYPMLGNLIGYKGSIPELNLGVGGGTGGLNVNTSTGEIGQGTDAQTGTSYYLYYNSASENGLRIAANVAPNSGVFPLEVDYGGGIPAFYVKGVGSSKVEVAVNNGQILTGYSGNQATATWSLSSANGSFNSAAPQTTVSCSTSGTAVFSEPEQGASDKRVMIHLAACIGTASYTYPTAFTNTPSCFASSLVACTVAGTISTSAVTVTGTTSTGALVLEDY